MSAIFVTEQIDTFSLCLGLDAAAATLYSDEIHKVPAGIHPWGSESAVVCSQPSRNFSRPDGLEDPEELINASSN